MATKKPIDRLTIRGFKSIRDLSDFPLRQLNVLIGPNGSGKSNLVAYFRMLSELVEGRLQVWTKKQGAAERIVTFGLKETTQIESCIKFGLNGYRFVLDATADGGFTFSEESLFSDGPCCGPSWTDLGSGQSEAHLKAGWEQSPAGSVQDYCYGSISSWTVFHFHDTSETAGVKRLGDLHDSDYLRSDASNLAAFLNRLLTESPDVYKQIRNVIRLAIPFFDDFILKPQTLRGGEKQIRLLWRQKKSDYMLWPSQLSDGSLRYICLVIALLQPEPPSTIIIDEPELGLHPHAITLLASLLRSASKRMQVIVSTQSVPLVNEFSIGDLVVVEREEGASVFKRHQEDEFEAWLREYSVGELWEKNLLGGRPST